MNFELEIQKAFEKLKQRDVFCFIAKVLEVDKENGVCKIDDGELEYTDVRLSAIIDGNDQKCFVFPKIGSTILVEPINEDLKQLYVAKYSEVESISGIIEETKYIIDKKGFNISRNNENLQTVLNDWMDEFGNLCDEVNKVVVSVGVTPNVGMITKIRTKVTTKIKQRLNTILTT